MKIEEYIQLINSLKNRKINTKCEKERAELQFQIEQVEQIVKDSLTSWDRVCMARDNERAKAQDYIEEIFDDFIEFHGDRCYGDDNAIISGIAMLNDMPVTIIAQAKGKTTEEKIMRNFGMPNPEGYRKALRLAHQAEKFARPIITFIDTAGAYPGKGAEERGQAQAIAECLAEFSNLKTIVICVVIGEGGSGGALALSVGDEIIMLENAIYSILSPEGFASILWKDGDRYKEASEIMGLTSYDLEKNKIIDKIIKEPLGGVKSDIEEVAKEMKKYIYDKIVHLKKQPLETLLEKRYEKYRIIGGY